MKNSFLAAATLLLLTCCASKNGGNDSNPQFQSMIGKWELQRITYNITEQNGDTKQSSVEIKKNGKIIVHEYFDDGNFIATDEGGATVEHRWELQVSQFDGLDIEQGKLKITGGDAQAIAETFGQTELVYDIATAHLAGSPTVMNLSIDATSIGPYKKNILTYVYHKI